MLEQRSLKLDLVALGLLALAIFLGMALASYDPADPPSSLVWPERTQIANSCGRSGAIAADLLLRGLGLGAYYLVASLAVLDALLLTRRTINDPILRAIGWSLSLFGVTTFASLALPRLSPGPVIGAGGYLGASGRGLLEMHFASAGALVLTISLTLTGLLLSTDYLLIRLAGHVVGFSIWTISKASPRRKPRRSEKPKTAGLGAQDQPRQPFAIKISGKSTTDELETDEEEDQDAESLEVDLDEDGSPDEEDDELDEEGDADPVAKPGVASRLATALRIKTPGKNEREEVMKELDEASRTEESRDYDLPSIDLLLPGETISFEEHEKDVRRKAKILEKTFASFGFKVKVVEIETGPVIAQFEIELEAGLRLSKITSLADDLAIALRVPSVRIVAPIPGKNTVGIEVPNNERQLVRIREVIEESAAKSAKMRIPIYLGKDVSGKPLLVDLSTLPHLLIAGRTGTGKSVCLNSIIISMLMSRRPDEVRMLMIDPKMVELSPYKKLPHLMHPVVTDMRKAEAILAWAVEKMEERYALLARAGVRHIGVYNQLGEEELMDRLQPESDEERKNIPLNLPYIVIVADEMADLMMTAAKEVEQHIIRLAQKSRAVGIHLVLATQKPTVDVITGLIKSNLPARIAFQVASRTDSRVVLDEMGADKLLGNGDMLFLWPGTSMLLRGQGTYVSDDEINRVVDFVGTSEPEFVKELVQLKTADSAGQTGKLPNRDELYEAAVDLVVREGRGSVSLLQRALGIGYGRAARLVDFMAEDGIVGQYNGSQAREVLITVQQWEEMSAPSTSGSASAGAAPSSPTARALRPASAIPESRKTSPAARGKSVGSDHEGSDKADEDLLDEDNDGTDEFEEDGDLVEEVELEDEGEVDDADEYDQDDEEADEEEPEPKHTTPNRRRSHRSTA